MLITTLVKDLAVYSIGMDQSNGYEGVSVEFLAGRGSSSRSSGIGVKEVRNWAKTLPHGSSVIDLGCGPGFPLTAILVEEGLQGFRSSEWMQHHRLLRRSNATSPVYPLFASPF
jgi:hypothetical protein